MEIYLAKAVSKLIMQYIFIKGAIKSNSSTFIFIFLCHGFESFVDAAQ